MTKTGKNAIEFNNKEGHLLTIEKDGTIVRGPAFTTNDEASLEFWKIIENARASVAQQTIIPDAEERN